MADHYQILGVARDATLEQIKAAYKRLAMKWHPDKNSERQDEANEKFKEINQAYGILGDSEKRRRYNLGVPEEELDRPPEDEYDEDFSPGSPSDYEDDDDEDDFGLDADGAEHP